MKTLTGSVQTIQTTLTRRACLLHFQSCQIRVCQIFKSRNPLLELRHLLRSLAVAKHAHWSLDVTIAGLHILKEAYDCTD